MPVLSLVTLTLAAGIVAPVESVTVPVIWPGSRLGHEYLP